MKKKKLTQKQYEVKLKELKSKPQRNPYSDIGHGRKGGPFTPEEEKRAKNKETKELLELLEDVNKDFDMMEFWGYNHEEEIWEFNCEETEYNDIMKDLVNKKEEK